MGERSELPRLYIAVDPSKLVRCSWCGSLESEDWEHAQIGTFCSKSCLNAAESTRGGSLFACFWIVLMIAIYFSIGGAYLFTNMALMVCIIGLMVLGLCFLVKHRKGMDSASKIPKDSRRKESLDDITLLKTIMTHFECPNCDANIDVADIKADQVFHCGYCNASGIVEITFIGK